MYKKGLLLLTLLTSTIFVTNFKKGGGAGVLYGDALGYYMYLPATFIYHNLDSITTLPEDKGIDGDIFWYTNEMAHSSITPKGYVLDQYTFGVAIMEMPFFFAAHAYAKATGKNANGFSKPYQNAIRWSSVIYTLLGLLILYQVLRRFFSENVAVTTIAILFLGSNLFWFTLYQAGMSHIPLFFLFALLLLATIKLYENPQKVHFISVGLLCGFITFIRPVDIVCIFIPLLYNIFDKESLQNKWAFFKKHRINIAIAVFMGALPFIPQLIYWKYMTGSFLYDSYGNTQTFNFLKPEIWYGLFSASNGWLFYSPALIVFFFGLFMWRKYKALSSVVFVIIPIYIYLIYSWFVPNYINGIGSRPMVDISAIVAIPLAAFIAFISTKKAWVITVFAAIMILCSAYSISFYVQQHYGLTLTEYNKTAFVAQTLFKSSLNYDDLVVNDIGEKQPNPKPLKAVTSKFYLQLNDTLKNTERDSLGNIYYSVPSDEAITPIQISIPYNKKTMGNVHWLKFSGVFKTADQGGLWNCQTLIYTVERGPETLIWRGLRVNNKIGKAHSINKRMKLYEWNLNEWGEVYFYSKLPGDIQDGDEIKLRLANDGGNTMQVKDVFIQMFE